MTLPPLNTTTIWAILNEELDDTAANALVWHCLGYRQEPNGTWGNHQVSPEWREAYPAPPNFIDSRPATVKLTRSIPPEYKQLLKEELGFKGYSVHELVPRRTRRATLANWLLGYMKHIELSSTQPQ
jgi:hypothetical protein